MQDSSKKILVIEDDTTTRNMFIDALVAEGFNTIGAENGIVGIQSAQEYLPDLVICDIMMPNLDGYGVLTALRQDPTTAIIPFIFLTGSGMKTEVRKGMELGADDYLTKPSTVDELLRAITSQFNKQSLLQSWYASQSSPMQSTSPEPEVIESSIFPNVTALQEVFDYIEANFQRGITLCDVAEAVGYSAAYLTHRVAKQTGDTVNSWIVKRRMVEARVMLQDTDHTIEQIATALGYQNACHFSRQFRQHHDIPPQAWRKKNQSMRRCLLAG
jgi:YesN/AraC family two-component response regulator